MVPRYQAKGRLFVFAKVKIVMDDVPEMAEIFN